MKTNRSIFCTLFAVSLWWYTQPAFSGESHTIIMSLGDILEDPLIVFKRSKEEQSATKTMCKWKKATLGSDSEFDWVGAECPVQVTMLNGIVTEIVLKKITYDTKLKTLAHIFSKNYSESKKLEDFCTKKEIKESVEFLTYYYENRYDITSDISDYVKKRSNNNDYESTLIEEFKLLNYINDRLERLNIIGENRVKFKEFLESGSSSNILERLEMIVKAISVILFDADFTDPYFEQVVSQLNNQNNQTSPTSVKNKSRTTRLIKRMTTISAGKSKSSSSPPASETSLEESKSESNFADL